MERILSKEEISELLSAVKEGEVETGSGPAGNDGARTVARLDLVRLPGPSHWKIPNLDIVLEAFARHFAASLTNRLQRSVIIKLAEIESGEFERILTKLTPYGAIGILSLEPFKSGGLLVFDERLAFVMLEMQLGGTAEGKAITLDRTLTTIEINILSAIIGDCCPDLQKAFSAIEPVHVELLKVENNPRLVNIVEPDTGVLAAGFTVDIDEFSGPMTLVIPHVSLEPMRERLRDTILSLSFQRSDGWSERLQQGVGRLHSTVAGQVAEVRLRLRDILNFQVGDVIEFGGPRNSQVKVLVEGRHKFNGVVGVRNGGKAVRINEIFLHGVDNEPN